MKFVKLIRPLFLVALGLHGLALFLPIGEISKTAEVEVAEETTPAEKSSLSEKLPVPDLNVAADRTTSVPASGTATGVFGSILSPTAVGSTTPATLATRSGAAVRSAPLAAATPNAAATRATPMGNPSASSGSAPTAPPSSAVDSSPPLLLPNAETTNSSVKAPANESADEGITELRRSLFASASHQLPDSLKALMSRWAIALTYNPKGTDDNGAKTAQSKWLDKINAQASGIGVGSLEPELVEDFAQVSYPIESSVRDREQSFRVCLDQPPSPAEVGVLFDSQGKIAIAPELIRSTGYKAINKEIIATVEAAETFPQDRLSKAFIFEVGVDYDKENCVKLSDLKS